MERFSSLLNNNNVQLMRVIHENCAPDYIQCLINRHSAL